MPSVVSKSNGHSPNNRCRGRHHKNFSPKSPPTLNPSRRHHYHHIPRQHQHHRTGHRDASKEELLIPDHAIRDLREPLHLLHRKRSNFFILDDVTGTVYTVHLSNTPSCNCHKDDDDYYYQEFLFHINSQPETFCKHVKFVFMQVLGVPFDDVCYKRKKLSNGTVRRLKKMPTLHESLSPFNLCIKFHGILFEKTKERVSSVVEIKDGVTCPVCLDEFGGEEEEEEDNNKKVVACDVCKNHIHKECFRGWKRKCFARRLDVTCVFCRAAWCANVMDNRINLYGKKPRRYEDDYYY